MLKSCKFLCQEIWCAWANSLLAEAKFEIQDDFNEFESAGRPGFVGSRWSLGQYNDLQHRTLTALSSERAPWYHSLVGSWQYVCGGGLQLILLFFPSKTVDRVQRRIWNYRSGIELNWQRIVCTLDVGVVFVLYLDISESLLYIYFIFIKGAKSKGGEWWFSIRFPIIMG